METRREARELVLKILFQHEYGQVALERAVENMLEFDEGAGRGLTEKLYHFIRDRVEGIHEQKGELDRIIEKFSQGWEVSRLARVDLIILRLALYEIIWCPDIPAEVAIDEAIELAKEYSGPKSGRFINGILGEYLVSEGLKTRT